jgi:hypothetical protein
MASAGFASKDLHPLVQIAPYGTIGRIFPDVFPHLSKINDLGEVRIRFRFVLIQKLTRTKSCGRFHYWLWMESAWRCADSANHITSSRQALIPTRGIIGRVNATARTRAFVGVPRAYRLSEF